MTKVICVGLGGAIGAIFRYLISLIPIKSTFPILTLVTNLSGAILIGIIVGLVMSDTDISDNQVLFWKTGICGGFTTFSTFSLEALQLIEKGKIMTGGLYIIISVALCITGVWVGNYISHLFFVK